MEQKIEIKFFVFQIIAFELGVTNSHNIERALPIRSQSVNKHPLDFT